MKKTEQGKTVFNEKISVFAWLTLFIAVAVAVFTIIASFSSEENGKEIFGYKLLIVTSDSMSKSEISENEEIFFDAGDLIVIGRVEDPDELEVGDVITFLSYNPESYGKTVTHKIREIRYSPTGEASGFVTYGINKGKNDTTIVSPENIIGQYAFKIAGIGSAFAFLKTQEGYYISVLIPAVLLIIFFSIKLGRALGKKDIAEEYYEELETLKQRVTALEERERAVAADAITSTGPPITAELEEMIPKAEGAIFENSVDSFEEDTGAGLSIPRGQKLSFTSKILGLDERIQEYFHTLHNELVSYKRVKSRLSFKCMSYRLGRKLLAKITVYGKTLKLHLNLDVSAFNENIFFQKDLSAVKLYKEVPFTVKLKSRRGAVNALKLISALAEKLELKRNEKFLPIDIIGLLKGIELDAEEAAIEELVPSPVELIEDETIDGESEEGLFIPRGKKLSFTDRLLALDDGVREFFDRVHNELISYKRVKPRVSFKCVSYRLGKKLIAKMAVCGKTLKLHLNLDVSAFNENIFFQKDLSAVKLYEEVPFTVKLKSRRGAVNALKLISALAEKYGLTKKSN